MALFSGLAVAQQQFALAAPDRHQCVDHLQAGLQGGLDRSALHDRGRRPFDRQARAGDGRCTAIERPSQRVDNAAEQCRTDAHVHHASGALDLVARADLRIISQQHDADVCFVDIEGDAHAAVRKTQQLFESGAGQPRDERDADGDAGDGSRLDRQQGARLIGPRLRQGSKRASICHVEGRVHAAANSIVLLRCA